jgi:phosphoglycerol transferase MdoB-like AlkP superfamily enzyme
MLDDFQKTWQSQPEARVRVAPEVLLAELRRNQRNFKLTIFWRDFREVLAAAAMTVFFAYQGFDKGWSWFLLAGACLWVGGFILVDRYRRRGRAARFGDSLLGCVGASLEDVEHQIWLLRNVLWWYILPLAIGMAIVVISMAIQPDDMPWFRWIGIGVIGVVLAATNVFVYWLNQWAVRRHLEPRRQELLAVRESLLKSEE